MQARERILPDRRTSKDRLALSINGVIFLTYGSQTVRRRRDSRIKREIESILVPGHARGPFDAYCDLPVDYHRLIEARKSEISSIPVVFTFAGS